MTKRGAKRKAKSEELAAWYTFNNRSLHPPHNSQRLCDTHPHQNEVLDVNIGQGNTSASLYLLAAYEFRFASRSYEQDEYRHGSYHHQSDLPVQHAEQSNNYDSLDTIVLYNLVFFSVALILLRKKCFGKIAFRRSSTWIAFAFASSRYVSATGRSASITSSPLPTVEAVPSSAQVPAQYTGSSFYSGHPLGQVLQSAPQSNSSSRTHDKRNWGETTHGDDAHDSQPPKASRKNPHHHLKCPISVHNAKPGVPFDCNGRFDARFLGYRNPCELHKHLNVKHNLLFCISCFKKFKTAAEWRTHHGLGCKEHGTSECKSCPEAYEFEKCPGSVDRIPHDFATDWPTRNRHDANFLQGRMQEWASFVTREPRNEKPARTALRMYTFLYGETDLNEVDMTHNAPQSTTGHLTQAQQGYGNQPMAAMHPASLRTPQYHVLDIRSNTDASSEINGSTFSMQSDQNTGLTIPHPLPMEPSSSAPGHTSYYAKYWTNPEQGSSNMVYSLTDQGFNPSQQATQSMQHGGTSFSAAEFNPFHVPLERNENAMANSSAMDGTYPNNDDAVAQLGSGFSDDQSAHSTSTIQQAAIQQPLASTYPREVSTPLMDFGDPSLPQAQQPALHYAGHTITDLPSSIELTPKLGTALRKILHLSEYLQLYENLDQFPGEACLSALTKENQTPMVSMAIRFAHALTDQGLIEELQQHLSNVK